MLPSSSVQYHFVSRTASNFNVCVVVHLGLAILSSVYDTDVTASLAVMGLIAILNYNIGLLFLYILFAPVSFIVDICRMVSVHKHYSSGGAVFFILVRIVSIGVKFLAAFLGYQVYRSASEGESGYEQINGPGQPSTAYPQPQQPPAPAQESTYATPPPPQYYAPPPSTGPAMTGQGQ